MRINVELYDHGHRLRFTPDPAVVRVGEVVSWRFRTEELAPVPVIRWEVYFSGVTPFSTRDSVFAVRTGNVLSYGGSFLRLVDHHGELEVGKAEKEGEYKYGIRAIAEIGQTEQVLEDEDPVLIVIGR